MKSGAIHHPKLRKLKRLLGVPLYAAAGILEAMWQFAAEYAVDGDLSRFSAEDIAEWVEWEGPPDLLLSSLVGACWLDDEGGLCIHDWEDHCPDFVKKRITRRKTKDLQQETADNGGQRRTTADNGADVCLPPPRPNPTQPNPTDVQSDSSEPPPVGDAAELNEPLTEFVFPCTGRGAKTWQLPVSVLEVLKASYPALDAERHVREALAWCHTNPTKRKTARGMPAFLNSWFERNQNRQQVSRAGPVATPTTRRLSEEELRAKVGRSE